MVEIPPKLITKLARQVASFRFFRLLKLRQPFVISITPFKKAEREVGSSEKMGEKHSIIIKKIVIIVPTESIAVVEERTTLPISKEEFSLKKSLFCEKFTFFSLFSPIFSCFLLKLKFLIKEKIKDDSRR